MVQQLKPYSVTQGKKHTDWWAELTILKEMKNKGKENWTEEEDCKFSTLISKSANWVTCACGNTCSIIPRNSSHAPEDYKLATLGKDFYHRVAELDVEEAVSILEKIEKRSEELIKKILIDQHPKTK